MEQIYYTQCPIGYGLGASNGFQVKRLSPGYPVTGDFRQLGMRAFLPGTRTPSPAVLRYRAGGDAVAEIAILTPRTHEYETERGRWGRPGGHFAHGLRLDGPELSAIGHWPAGLFGRPFWTSSDPEPSLGRPPEPFAMARSLLRSEPTFPTAAALAAGRDVDLLATLLTALAAVTRDGRTLVLIDRPDRLADHVALLTLALPEVWRGAVTFSTYHDRPEELPGFRLQGTGPDPRLNRQALLAHGSLADLTSETVEPAVRPTRWALRLASWIVGHSGDDRAAWEATDRRASAARPPDVDATFPADDWLDSLFDLPAHCHTSVSAPAGPEGWKALGDLAVWARGAGLGNDLAGARRPPWWREHTSAGDRARGALVEHLRLPGNWSAKDGAAGWGIAVAGWLDLCPTDHRPALLSAALAAAPVGARATFLTATLGATAPEVARESLRWLRAHGDLEPTVLLPLEVRGAFEGGDPRRTLRGTLTRAAADPACLADVLAAVAGAARDEPRKRTDGARAVSEFLAGSDERAARVVLRWALGMGDAATDWLGPFLRAISAAPDALDRWRALAVRVDSARAGTFARVALQAANDPAVPDEVFRWGVETLLLPLAGPHRPHDPGWPGVYLDRTPSGLELLRRLFTREYRELGVKRWLDGARERGELSPEQAARVDGCANYARALKTGDARALLRVDLPAVSPAERGALLAQMLTHVGSDSGEALDIALDTCRAAWPAGFLPGSEGLPGLADVIAERLVAERAEAEGWLARLTAVIGRLGLLATPEVGFEPDGLAAEVIAATTRRPGEGFSPWRFRQFLLRHDTAWRALGADARNDVAGRTPDESLAALDLWDRSLAKGVHTARFFEVWLNSCDPPALASAVALRAGDLKTLPALPWWGRCAHPGASDDLRDAFGRLAPMAPLDEDAFPAVQSWMGRGPRIDPPGGDARPLLPSDLVPLDDDPPAPNRPARGEGAIASPLSDLGRVRWRCVEALTAFHRPGLGADACWQTLESWGHDLPLDQLDEPEKYLFLAWLIPRLEGADSLRVARLADWLVRSGLTEPDRVNGWAEGLGRWTEVPVNLMLARAQLVTELRSEWKTVLRDARERPRKRREADSPSPP